MGNMATAQEVLGLSNVATHIAKLIDQIGQDKPEQERAKRYGQALAKMNNEIKGLAQRLQEQMQAQNGDSGVDAETKAKIEALLITAKAKAANTREAHSQRTAQRQAQFELEQQREDERHQLELNRELQRQQVEDVATDIKTAAEIKRERAKAAAEPKKPSNE
jgi:predicted type IV restriction endonuclease